MRKLLLTLIPLILMHVAIGQTGQRTPILRAFTPKIQTINHKLGDRILQIKTYQYGSKSNVVYVNLHDDEVTAIHGAKKQLERKPGLLIKIENNKSRNIRFRMDGQYYTFDPNRIFSRSGITQTLTMYGRVSPKAINEVEKFANQLLQLIPKEVYCIIALHNNTNGKYSVNSYLPGNIREKDARGLYVNPEEDPDDIFLTTDSLLFSLLAEDQYNVILQDNARAKRDGSLSIYCGERNIRYLNCETEHGRDLQYQQMIMIAAGHIDSTMRRADVIAYNYKLVPNTTGLSPKTNTEIMFGEKKVGLIRSVTTDSSWATIGKLEVNKDFPLYSNMEVLFFPSNPQSSRFEVRIDPTRERELLDPTTTTVNIRAVK
ncbi:MAG: hypothetical protein H7Y42_18170 [Chitinophagaceae bacterium]|nr:hypothetical protein [Chitinophagaceae bacterium]